eukprot:GHRR01029399.1.p1 GENE.GHRR01029399.1~~GHRR01029399.1.p1  ORF type:complete len:216 (+),score=26.68 GHRR01029399.1:658-1305(+)
MWSVKLRHLLPINQQRAVVCVAKARRMANSKYEYTKEFELDDSLLPSCWIVIRIDGKAFTKFSAAHKFEKPNDKRALDLMDECAKCVMQEFSEIKLAFGESDEYSFVLHKDTQLYGRRASKLVSTIASCFTGNYVRHWSTFLPVQPLLYTPVFDGRAVCYPTLDIRGTTCPGGKPTPTSTIRCVDGSSAGMFRLCGQLQLQLPPFTASSTSAKYC